MHLGLHTTKVAQAQLLRKELRKLKKETENIRRSYQTPAKFTRDCKIASKLSKKARAQRNQLSLKIKMGLCFSKTRNDGDDSDHNVTFVGGNVQLITTKESWDEKLSEARKDGKIVVANFSATWCGPCKVIAPFYCELSEKYPSLMYLTVDVDELAEFSTSWDIKATPTFFFLRDGQQVDKLVGANKPELQKKIIAIADSVPPIYK
ncbi:hypothetical protein LOK49_LG10G02442 [Camellia lanceoleosa]|uniref:Uncharacterized protein n=1 Tax=Camellia lanceoleosa TaxID=1840588 RepID=A0ACC0G6J1_9ERIC|nr:hypothetical protein LOK49_LG10G02442 [Camellia lanceoleosa]